MCRYVVGVLTGLLLVSPLLAEDKPDPLQVPVRVLQGHQALITKIVLSPDGKLLASSSHDKTLKLWDPRTGKILATLPNHGKGSQAMTFSSDGSLLAVSHQDHFVRIWDVATKREKLKLKGEAEVRALAFASDGRTLATATIDRKVQLWDLTQGRKIADQDGHRRSVDELKFSPDGRFLISRGWNDLIVWNRNGSSKRILRVIALTMTFSKDGKTLIFSNGHKITRWKLEQGAVPEAVTGVAWKDGYDRYHHDAGSLSPHGDALATPTSDPVVATLDGALGSVGKKCCRLVVMDGKTGKERVIAQQRGRFEDWVHFVIWSPDGRTHAWYHIDQSITLADAINGYSKVHIPSPAKVPYRDVLFTPDSKHLILSHGSQVSIWKVP